MRTPLTVSALLFTLALGSGSASAAVRARAYVRIGPPAPIVQVRPVAPRVGMVWVEGYHRWENGAFVWVPGSWMAPPRPHAVWVPGRWVHDRRGWYFVDGRWR